MIFNVKDVSVQYQGFPSVGLEGPPWALCPPHNSCVLPIKSKNCPPPPPHLHWSWQNFFRYFFNLCMTKANLTSITSLRMQTFLSYWNIKAITIEIMKLGSIRLQLHDVIYRPDSFVLMLHYCTNLKVIRYKSMSFNWIITNELHHVIAA